jgi:group I intron endonuclease
MYGIIYRVTGPTGKIYIGQTVQRLERRKSFHAFRAKKGDKRQAFQIAILEHGFSSFAWEEIDQAENQEELNQKEKQWIAHYNSADPAYGYNGTAGGIKTVYSAETRRKMSAAMRGKKRGPPAEGHRQKLSEALKGKKRSPEHCRKISESKKGDKHPMFGKHHTEEAKQKISEAMKRYRNKGKKLVLSSEPDIIGGKK